MAWDHCPRDVVLIKKRVQGFGPAPRLSKRVQDSWSFKLKHPWERTLLSKLSREKGLTKMGFIAAV